MPSATPEISFRINFLSILKFKSLIIPHTKKTGKNIKTVRLWEMRNSAIDIEKRIMDFVFLFFKKYS